MNCEKTLVKSKNITSKMSKRKREKEDISENEPSKKKQRQSAVIARHRISEIYNRPKAKNNTTETVCCNMSTTR